MEKLTVKASKLIAGVVQKGNNKILGSTWSIPPTACKVGAKLREVEGSTCHKCYDFKSFNIYPSVRQGRQNNLDLWEKAEQSSDIDALYTFASALATQILAISKNKQKKGEKGAFLHRWFTGGDLQSVTMLRVFVQVAKFLPQVDFWLPTREAGMVARYKALNLEPLPDNLTIRLSAPMIDGEPVRVGEGIATSTVHKDKAARGFECPAYKNEGNCGDCSNCWKTEIKNISYKAH